eukprot:11533611-Prorocentrum_lima.AAC.1
MRRIRSASLVCLATCWHAAAIPAMVRGTRSSSSSGALHARRRSCTSVMTMLGLTSPTAAKTASVG